MNKRKQSELNKNPLVRFIRWVRKLVLSLLKPDNNRRQSVHEEYGSDLDLPPTGLTGLENFRQGRLITVGELFAQVKWQLPEPVSPAADVSKNNPRRPQNSSWN
jgi:hypothetical protein